MRTSLRWLVVALIAWTAFVWGNRISNAWSSPTEATSAKVASTLLAASFLAFALASAWVLVRTWRRPVDAAASSVLVAFAAWTTAVWVVRTVGMLGADHEVGFKVVHAGLGVVSIALAALVARGALAARRPEAISTVRGPSR